MNSLCSFTDAHLQRHASTGRLMGANESRNTNIASDLYFVA